MKLKNIEVGDLIVAKIALEGVIDKGDICEVIAVEGSGYEGEWTLSVSLKGEICGWYNHEYFKKHRKNGVKKSEINDRLNEHELRLTKLELLVESEDREVLSVEDKELVGNELAKAMLKRGDKVVTCGVGKPDAVIRGAYYRAITEYSVADSCFRDDQREVCIKDVTPVDSFGKPLTGKDVGL